MIDLATNNLIQALNIRPYEATAVNDLCYVHKNIETDDIIELNTYEDLLNKNNIKFDTSTVFSLEKKFGKIYSFIVPFYWHHYIVTNNRKYAKKTT